MYVRISYTKSEEVIMEGKKKSVYEVLSKIDVSKFTEKKNGLTYLTWSYAWSYVLEHFPESTYDIVKDESGLPYFIDTSGAMVYTSVTIEGITRPMWLPVMDGANKSMKVDGYSYKTKYAEKQVEPISMFDVNKALMRCLVKNLAMFGLGIQVYVGEDLPLDLSEDTKDDAPKVKKPTTTKTTTQTSDKATKEQVSELKKLAKEAKIPDSRMKEKYGNFIYTTPFMTAYNKAFKDITDYLAKAKK